MSGAFAKRFLCPRQICTIRKSFAQRASMAPFNINIKFMSSEKRGGKDDEKGSRRGALATIGLGASLLLGKTKYLLAALKITKAAPLISMLLTSATYSLFFGWPYACGMVGMIFVHECGHAIAMHHYKVPFSPMVFIPFMGAVIAMKESPVNAHQEAVIALGGPLLGTAGAVAVSVAGTAMDSQLLLALADFGLIVNLFNLLPIGSLDGGRITNAISPYFGVVGLAIGGDMIYEGMISNPLFYLVMAGGVYSTGKRIFFRGEDDPPHYYNISGKQQASIFAAYVALIAAALYAVRENNRKRKTPKQLQAEKDNPWYSDLMDHGTSEGGVYDDFFADMNNSSHDNGGKFW